MVASSLLPQTQGALYLAYAGMETDLIFTRGLELPGFASFPLLESADGRAMLTEYFENIIEVGRQSGTGVILESPTWVANRDRGAQIDYAPETINALNIQAVEMMRRVRAEHQDVPVQLSLNIGPRADAYAPAEQMSELEAENYHAEQIGAISHAPPDLISGYTIAYPQEAIGIVRAAKRFGFNVIISFTVETDGHLPTGMGLGKAIDMVDHATDGYAAYFMINCAHPDHFNAILSDAPWMTRLKGIVANASRCSHAELDEATELDDGNAHELGEQLAKIRETYPNITILGGCCGTDMRHMRSIAMAASKP